jgi:tetraacyldisaccharide 4'-kinase
MIPCLPVVVFSLQPRSLQRLDGSERPLSEIQGRKVLLVTAIADPGSLELQLRREGAVCSTISFRDHHDFGVRDVARLVAASEQTDMVVCTLKDAVKLEEKWPRAAKPLWYVSQVVEVERGHEVLARTLDDIIGINPGFAPLLPRARRAMRINGN